MKTLMAKKVFSLIILFVLLREIILKDRKFHRYKIKILNAHHKYCHNSYLQSSYLKMFKMLNKI